MNSVQDLFDFQVIVNDPSLPYFHPPETSCPDLLEWLDGEINKFENNQIGQNYLLDYWIGITSENIKGNLFIDERPKEDTKTGKPIAIITSFMWQRAYSPPSLFEYIALNAFQSSVGFLDCEFDATLLEIHETYVTKGCIFDYDQYKPHIRISVSNPNLCNVCKSKMICLEQVIERKTGEQVPPFQYVSKVLSRHWMGSVEEKDSPFYTSKRNYRYDVDHNSGFYKTWIDER
jgi:hypothetical protein